MRLIPLILKELLFQKKIINQIPTYPLNSKKINYYLKLRVLENLVFQEILFHRQLNHSILLLING